MNIANVSEYLRKLFRVSLLSKSISADILRLIDQLSTDIITHNFLHMYKITKCVCLLRT